MTLPNFSAARRRTRETGDDAVTSPCDPTANHNHSGGVRARLSCLFALLVTCSPLLATSTEAQADQRFAGIVSSASPEATAVGVAVLEQGGNAIDAAVAVSLALGVSEPAGSGIAGQTVMLVQPVDADAFVIQGTTWSPGNIPADATSDQLAYGHTASSVPSTLRVLDSAHQKFGSGKLDWPSLVTPSVRLASQGVTIGPFRARAFAHYHQSLLRQPAAAGIFVNPQGRPWQAGEVFRQPLLAATLERIATAGAMDFYQGQIAAEIARDMQQNQGWIRAEDLRDFPEPAIVPAISSHYRGFEVLTLPPPFGGWVVLNILNHLQQSNVELLASDSSQRRLALLDAMREGHGLRQQNPITDYVDYQQAVQSRIAAPAGTPASDDNEPEKTATSGETTHFSIVDGDGMAVAVTQSIDSYFGAHVVHPELGFLYNNYMQGFQVDDPDAPYYLRPKEMPKSSMSATVVRQDGRTVLVLGSPGSARIISAVAQVSSHWIDVNAGIEQAVAAYRVHVVPPDKAYVEGEEIPPEILAGMARRDYRLVRPKFGVSDSALDAYFGGVHAIAWENGHWTGAADPRRDGTVGTAWRDD